MSIVIKFTQPEFDCIMHILERERDSLNAASSHPACLGDDTKLLELFHVGKQVVEKLIAKFKYEAFTNEMGEKLFERLCAESLAEAEREIIAEHAFTGTLRDEGTEEEECE